MPRTITLILTAIAVALGFYFCGDENDNESASDAQRVVTVIVAGTCGENGCSAKRSRCTVDVESSVFTSAYANGAEAALYHGDLSDNGQRGTCPIGAVIVGVEREEDSSDSTLMDLLTPKSSAP